MFSAASSVFSAGFLAAAAAAAGFSADLLVANRDLQNPNALTQLLELSLVALATGDGLLLRLGSGGLGLDGGNPAVTLTRVGGLEGVLDTVNLEEELVGSLLGDVGSISLRSR